MTSLAFRVAFVDDREDERQYMSRLQRAGTNQIEWEFLTPDSNIEDFADRLIAKKYDLILLDYRLDEIPHYDANQQVINRYRAATLGQYIRDEATQNPNVDLPLVVVSQEANAKRYYDPDLTAHDLFDLVVLKNEINQNTRRIAQQLLALITGYTEIKAGFEKAPRVIDLAELLKLSADETAVIDLQEIAQVSQLFAPHQVARELFRIFIMRAGLLLSRHDVIARLGVDPNSEDWPQLETILSQSQVDYSGVFSTGWKCWWRHRFESWLADTVGSSWGSLTSLVRAEKLNATLQLNFSPAVSRTTKDSNVLSAIRCVSCNSPTEIVHTVPTYEPRRYSFLEKQRVCWECVKTGEYLQRGITLDNSAKRIIERLQKGED